MLLLECSFLLPEDKDRAREYAHIHLDDILERAHLFENEAIVLTHFSQRYRPEEIRQALAAIPDELSNGSSRSCRRDDFKPRPQGAQTPQRSARDGSYDRSVVG